MRILITGHAGFIGNAITQEFIRAGHDILGIDDLSGASHDHKIVKFIVADVSNYAQWKKVAEDFNPEVIIHCAASFANEKSVDFPALDARVNIQGTIMVAQFAREKGIKLIYMGSSSSYGYAYERLSEITPTQPSTPYALSKLTGENYALMLNPGKTVVLRLFNVFGPGDKPALYRNAIPNMVESARTARKIKLYGVDSARDFTPISFVVDIVSEALWRPISEPIVNVCSGEAQNMTTVARVIANKLPAVIDVLPRRGWDKIPSRCGDPSLLAKTYAASGPYVFKSFEVYLNETIEWLLAA